MEQWNPIIPLNINIMKTLNFYLLLISALVFFSCDKENSRQVIYRITDSASGFNVRYLDVSGELISEKIITQSAQDVWNYSFQSEDGGIVFVSTNYKDPESAIKVQIMIDGKIYKQAASKNDTISFITVSGVVPIEE
jgi:hypothetical protein